MINFFGASKKNFYFEFYENGIIIPYYSKIKNKTNHEFVTRNGEFPVDLRKSITYVSCVPHYFETILDEKANCKAIKIESRKGFIVNLEECETIDVFFKKHLKKNAKNIRPRMKRLEKCFDIEFKSYYGEIGKNEYDDLFEAFQALIQKRFSQKGVEHEGMKRWSDYKNNVFDLILAKKACLNVISERNRPISISLSFCYQNICVYAITSYDIDYYKFGLGQTHIVKCLEWCLENGFKHYDMMWGEYPYKIEWSNDTFYYNDHVLYVGNNLGSRIKANMIVLAAKIRKKKLYSKLINFIRRPSKGKSNAKEEQTLLTYKVREIDALEDLPNMEKLTEQELDTLTFLKRPICEFQYVNSDHYSSISVGRMDDSSYIIKGESKKILVTFV